MMASIQKDPKDVKDKEKRKRRTIKTEVRSASPTTPIEVIKKVRTEAKSPASSSNARALFNMEEEEAAQRDPIKDQELQGMACDEIRKMMGVIKDLKDSSQMQSVKMEQSRIHGMLQFVTLKKLNRLAHMRCKGARDATNEAKQKIDKHHLQLQNLLYEVNHLQKEITKCLQFKSKDEDINLVSVDEFYEDAPEDISKPEVTKTDVHQQTLARLDWELEQRKRLSDKLKDSESNKEVLAQEIKSTKGYLESLQPKLNNILLSTKPVQDSLGMPFDDTREQHRRANYLPRSLYVLYMQASAYCDACDKQLKVKILGDVDVARAMDDAPTLFDEDSDSDQEEQEKPSKKRRNKRGSGDRRQQKQQKILKKHPLSINLEIGCKDGCVLHLTFHHLVYLQIVTVTVKLSPGKDTIFSTISGGDLLTPDSLLNCLYDEDFGIETPNPSNKFVLNRLGLKSFSSYISEVGHPYQWAQWLSGVQFLNTHEAPKVNADLSATHMEETIKRLRRRLKARVSLQKQLAALERSSLAVNSEYQHLFPTKINTRLSSWKRSTHQDFVAVPYTRNCVAAGFVQKSDMFFTGVMERGSARLTFQIVVNSNYPISAPLFAVSILWNTERTNLNDENVRDMEGEVNIHFTELMKTKSCDQLLTNQLQRLLMCFDVYLETESENSAIEGPTEFSKEKIFPRLVRGPQRSRPYKYNAHLGFFSQR